MFPFVNGFHFTPMHLIFLGVFFCVLAVIGTTFVTALLRSWRAFRLGKQEEIRWHSDFHDLPARDRACRHELTGEFKHRTCERGFECGACDMHAKLPAPAPARTDGDVFGLEYPADRYYHRGHTWVKPEADGTVTIGLDDIGRRLTGEPDALVMPEPGTRLTANGTGWRMRKGQADARILAPLDGEVIETGSPENGWLLKVRPNATEFPHLLRGAEVAAWVRHELDRLQMAMPRQAAGAALADGGVLLPDIPAGAPGIDLDALYGEMFLEP